MAPKAAQPPKGPFRTKNGIALKIVVKDYRDSVLLSVPIHTVIFPRNQRMSDAAVANAALVLSSKNWKQYSRWGAASKNKSKKPWDFCCRTGIDAALVRVQFVLRGCTHHRK